MTDRVAVRAFGALYLLAGVLGFVPGVTTRYGDLRLAGGSHAHLLGEFRVSILLNLVHLALGVAAVVAAPTIELVLASLGLWLLGVFTLGGFLSLDSAENWLHFGLGVGLLGLTSLAARGVAARPA